MPSELHAWLIARVALDTGAAPDTIDLDTPLYRLGVDSRTLAFIVDGAEQTFALAADLDRISPAESLRTLIEAMVPIDGVDAPARIEPPA